MAFIRWVISFFRPEPLDLGSVLRYLRTEAPPPEVTTVEHFSRWEGQFNDERL